MPFGSTSGIVPIMARTIQQIGNIGREIPEDREPFPIHLRNEIDNLERQLAHSLPNTSLPVRPFHGMDIETVIDTNLSIAWHVGAHIFYENCINKECGSDAVVGMDEIMVCLDRVEDIKILVQPEIELRDEPITWPAFVTSCNASASRQSWRRWWERMSIYESANINLQWNLIRGIWHMIDESGDGFNWVRFIEGEGDGLVPLDIVIEHLGMDGMSPIWNPSSP